MTSKRLRLGVDFDEVIADLHAVWLARYNREHGTNWTPADLTEWDIWKPMGCEPADVYKHLTPSIYDTVRAVPDAIETIHAIEKLGHAVVVVTSVMGDEPAALAMADAKRRWLELRGLNRHAMTMIAVGPSWQHKRKADVQVDWLIDDNVPNVEDFPGYALLVTRPHNRGVTCYRKRIRGLQDVVPMLAFESQPSLMHEATMQGAEQLRRPAQPIAMEVGPNAVVRQFASGATRDVDTNKLDYEGFLSSRVLRRFAEYMHKNRFHCDGSMRASDNWQKGIPAEAYMKSMWRHFMGVWEKHRSHTTLLDADAFEDELCAMLFNVQGMLHEHLKAREQINGVEDAAA